MKKFTLFLMSMFLFLGTAMAQSYSLTETRLSSDELNAKTASTLIAIKNLSATNNYYFVGNTGATPYSAAEFSDAAVFVWQPVEEGVAGSYYLMKLDGTYMQATSPKDFGTVDGAVVFTSSNPTQANGEFNGDADSQAFVDDEALLVRFMNSAAGNWINVQNGDNGTPLYNSGKGGWTIHYVYAVEAATVEPEPEVETFAVTADLYPVVEGDITEIKCIRVQHNEGASISDFPTEWTLTNETGESFTLSYEWGLNNWDDILVYVNPAITEAGTYTLTIPAGSLTTDGGKECAAAEFSWTIVATVEPEPEPAAGIEVGKYYRIKATNGEYLTIGDSNANTHGHVHGAALDEANDNQVFTFIAVEGQENTYYVQSVAGKYFSYEGTGAGWNVNAADDVAQAHALTFEAAEGELQYLIKCYNASKSDYKYFKYEYVGASGKSHPYNDADISNAEVWTLEEVAVVEPEPETPFEVVAVTPAEAVAELSTITVEFSEEIAGTQDVMAMETIYVGSRSNACNFTVEGKVLTITLWTPITAAGEYALKVPASVGITRVSNGEAVTIDGEITFTVEEPAAPFEVVAVTPAEAVAELSTITVEFSEEIAGTQDVMAMETIYVGSRSNACNFTVEGKVLTITLWTPITTPGEYALKVPASVGITRVSNGEAVTIDGEITFTVEEPAAPFEVVAVTPAEAVAELSTITVEFSEEIAGTQDVMAMETIYVGSRSNACNFTVEGKVLTITLWTPITTPGEYALKVPASVGITRVSNGEAVTIDGEITFTVEEAVVEPEPETFPKLSNDETRYYYKIASYNRGGYLTSVGDGAGVEHIAETMASYWYFTKADENGGVYFHNYTSEQTLGADRTMSDTPAIWYVLANGVNEEGHAISSTNPISSSSCIDANNYNTGVGSWNPSATDWHGTTWVFSEVDVDAMVAELQAAREEFDAAYAEAQAIIAEANLQTVTEAIALQTTDETAAGYVWANTYAYGEEGVIAYLVDGDTGTFFHTDWGNYATDGTKDYIEVDLGEGNSISEFCINYVTRHNGSTDFPTSITLLGSNDKSEYTEIATIDNSLPVGNTKSYTSPILGDGNSYRYIRYQVNSTSRGDATIPYFHLAEFGISSVSATIADKYADLVSAVSNLQVVANQHANNADYGKDELIAATEDIYAALVEIFKDDNTVALIEAAYELLDIEGVGYPAAAPREALEEAIEIAEEMPDTEAGTALQAAIDAYYATTDVVLPEGGKAYTLTMVAKNGNKFYLNYTGSDIAMVARTTDEELPNSAKFVAEDNGDGTVSLKTIDGKYLVYHSKYAGVSWLQDGGDTDGLQEAKDAMTNITFAKMVNGNKVEATGNEQIFGMLTWYGKRGFDTGKNNDCYGYMVLKADGSDYDGAADAFWNDGYSSAFIVEETVIPVEPLKVVAVTPAEEVTSLREITIEFDAEIAVAELTGTERISIDYGWGVLIGTTATAEGNVLTLVTDTEIKDAGTYPLTIPAGVVTRVSDGVAYEGGTFEFTVVKEDVVVEPLTVVAVTPAEAVEAIETITIEFSDNVNVPATASGQFTIADAEGNIVATFAAWDAAVEGKVVTLTLTEAITTAGEYTFSFAEGLVTRQGDNATCAYSCTITVTFAEGIDGIIGEAGDATIYDLTGRKVEKINGSGIYIVNGKKVFVK